LAFFVAGYMLMALFDANVAFLPAVSLFATGSAFLVRPTLAGVGT
jgi:hypothetical protein